MIRSAVRRGVTLSMLFMLPVAGVADTLTIPFGTIVFGEIGERVTSRKKETSEGDLVRTHVWRDVTVEGRVVIPAGTPMMVRVSKVKKAKVAGIKGHLELEALSITLADGTLVPLHGGYDRSGRGRKALSITLAVVVFAPLIFIKGKQAILESGTVFDAEVRAPTDVAVEGSSGSRVVRIDLASGAELEIAVLYDQMDSEAKAKLLPMILKMCEGQVETANVVTVNDQQISPIPVQLGSRAIVEGCMEVQCDLDLKTVGKHFSRGINRFEIEVEGVRAEVVLEVEL